MDKREKFYKTLDTISEWKENYDGEGAATPNKHSIRGAKRLLKNLEVSRVKLPDELGVSHFSGNVHFKWKAEKDRHRVIVLVPETHNYVVSTSLDKYTRNCKVKNIINELREVGL